MRDETQPPRTVRPIPANDLHAIFDGRRPFGAIQDPPGQPLALGARRYAEPIRPTTAERLRIARLQERIGWACIAVSVAIAIYFAAEMLRAVLS
jgi:hypothetical protein